jgi:hypothetical protein
MSKTFYVILPSDTRDPPENRSNKFTVRLPKTLNFTSLWLCGLSSIIYPHSFAAIGTTQPQYIYLLIDDGRFHWPYSLVRIKFPSGSYKTPEALANKINETLARAAAQLEASWEAAWPYGAHRAKRALLDEEREADVDPGSENGKYPCNYALLHLALRTCGQETKLGGAA